MSPSPRRPPAPAERPPDDLARGEPPPLHGGPLTFLRFARRNRLLTPRLRLPAPAPGVVQAALPRAPADRRPRVHLPGGQVRDRQGRDAAPRPLVVGRQRLEDPRPRGRGPDRREDRPGPGVHDLGLPARLDRARVHRRRPRDAHRLRPRRRGGRAADPPAGHLQARRPRRPQLLDRATARRSCAARRSATTRSSGPTRSSRRTSRRTRSWRGVPAQGRAHARRRPSACGGRETPAEIERTILDLLARRDAGQTICPSEAARALAADWRPLMEPVRATRAARWPTTAGWRSPSPARSSTAGPRAARSGCGCLRAASARRRARRSGPGAP